MSHFNWNLVAYVNLADPGYKYQSIRSQYEATAEICELMTERFGSTEISNACEQFVQLFARATLPYLYEIETSHRNMLLSIGDKDTGNVRARRGLAHTVQQVANVLYGMYSSIDTEFIFNKIIALSQNKSQNITLNLERMRIMQVETDNQVKEISQHEEKLEENLRYLQKQTEIIIQELDRIEFKTRLLEQALLFEILLNQYSYEIQNLMSIINSAMNGKIHTSVFTSDRLLVELREIKMNLAVGTALPLEIKAESLTGFLQVSDLTIFHREHYLVFSIEIPLTSVEEYTMYHPIPLPIIYNENTIALISPEVDYLALSNDDENFISLGVSQWEECTKLGSYTLCKGDQPIHYRAGSNLCELSHLISLESPLKDCGVKLVTLEAPIWHRLSKVNSWLYYTQRELCTIMCPDPPQTFRVEISGVGRLTVSPSCEIHTENSILVPFSKTNRDIKAITGTRWGSHPSTLLLVYKAIIRSKLDYGCFLFGSASFSNWNRLNKVQSSCLRSIMGYVRSSPLPAIEVESSCPPSNIRCRWLAGKFLLKSLSYSSSPIFDLFYSLFLTWRYVPKNLPVISLVANSVSPFHEYILTNIKLPIYEIEYQALLLPAQVLLFLIALVSMSCLQPLNSFSLNSHPSPLIIRIKSILFSLGQLDFNMQFLWVPSHVGFRGNEYANSLAKSSSNFISPSLSPIPWSDFTPLLRHHIFNLWSAYWRHYLLPSHAYKLNLNDSAFCNLHMEEYICDLSQILFDCPSLSIKRQNLVNSHNSLKVSFNLHSILNSKSELVIVNIISFIQEAGFII
ncbi:hypothetical protein QTP88_000455 [Uroleucon formosanum]